MIYVSVLYFTPFLFLTLILAIMYTNMSDSVSETTTLVSGGNAAVSILILLTYLTFHLSSQDGLYGVYAEVAELRTWIDEKIAANGGATFCS